ncbi:MAG: hypothetical protein ABSC08_03025 [Bryobacteraceae bacterium]
MELKQASVVLMGMAVVALAAAGGHSARAGEEPGRITINYPEAGSVFPPEITPPTFIWHDAAEGVTVWQVEVTFAGHAPDPGAVAVRETTDWRARHELFGLRSSHAHAGAGVGPYVEARS